jgi:hypothetical protein
MKRKGTIGVSAVLAFLTMIAAAPPAKAITDLTQVQLSDMVQSTANDVDMVLLTYLTGASLGGPTVAYKYSSSATDSTWASWSGSLTGAFAGAPLSLSYDGSLTGYPPGTVTWNTTGMLSGGSVAGGGSGAVSYPTASTFDLTFGDSLSYGGNTASVAISIPGTLLAGGNFMFGSPGSPEAGSGTLTVNGTTTDIEFGVDFKLQYFPPAFLDSVYVDETKVWIKSYGPGLFLTAMYNEVPVPEPSTWTMMLIGFAGLGYAGWRRAPTATQRRPEAVPALIL